MKRYVFSPKESSLFILNFEVNDDIIVANYADGSKYELNYTDRSKDIFLNRMKKQIESFDEYEVILKEIIKRNLIDFFINLSTLGISLSLMINLSNIFINFILSICVFSISSGCLKELFINSYVKDLLNDLYKNKNFVDNEIEINNNLRLLGMSSIDLNDVDKLDSNDIYELTNLSNESSSGSVKVLSKINQLKSEL